MRFATILELVTWSALVPLQAQAALSDRFEVNLVNNDYAGCGYVGSANMNSIWGDCLTLAERGLRALTDYDTNPAANRIVDAVFRNNDQAATAAQRTQLRNNYLKLQNWMVNGGLINNDDNGPDNGNNKPFLFCHHTWLEKKTMQDPIFDINGNTVSLINADALMRIQDHKPYVAKQQEASSALGAGKQAVPFWSPKHNDYLFDAKYGSGNAGYCSSDKSRAATQHTMKPSTITLCPRAFGSPSNSPLRPVYHGLKHFSPIVTTQAANVGAGTIPAGTTAIDKTFPTAANLFHEMFHLVLGNENTFPAVGEIYEIADILTADFDHSSVNPESYLFLAVAYDYTLATANDAGGSIEFWGGFATRG